LGGPLLSVVPREAVAMQVFKEDLFFIFRDGGSLFGVVIIVNDYGATLDA
jgi:hypothetical protein